MSHMWCHHPLPLATGGGSFFSIHRQGARGSERTDINQLRVTHTKGWRTGDLPVPCLTSTGEAAEPTATRELTFRGWPWARSPLSVQELRIAVVSDLQHKAAVHHTVSGLEAAMREMSMVQIPHALERT